MHAILRDFYMGPAGWTLCALALYGIILTFRVKTNRLPKEAVYSFYNWAHLQILFSFLSIGIGYQFRRSGGHEGFVINVVRRQMEILLMQSVSIVLVTLLMILVSGVTRMWPSFDKSGVFQVILIFSDICLICGTSLSFF